MDSARLGSILISLTCARVSLEGYRDEKTDNCKEDDDHGRSSKSQHYARILALVPLMLPVPAPALVLIFFGPPYHAVPAHHPPSRIKAMLATFRLCQSQNQSPQGGRDQVTVRGYPVAAGLPSRSDLSSDLLASGGSFWRQWPDSNIVCLSDHLELLHDHSKDSWSQTLKPQRQSKRPARPAPWSGPFSKAGAVVALAARDAPCCMKGATPSRRF